MQKIKAFTFHQPVIFTMLVLLLAIIASEAPLKSLFLPFLDPQSADYLSGIILQFGIGLLLLSLLIGLGLFQQANFRRPERWRDLWLLWPLVILTLLNCEPLWNGTLVLDTSRPLALLLFPLLMFSIGFFEEILGRGVVLLVLLQKWGGTRRGIYQAVLVSSLMFGAAHLINLIQNRYSLLANLTQIGYAFFFAVLFAACFLRLKSIWPVMILHATFDFASGLREVIVGGGLSTQPYSITPQDALVSLLITLPLCLYGLFLLRKLLPAQRPLPPPSTQYAFEP